MNWKLRYWLSPIIIAGATVCGTGCSDDLKAVSAGNDAYGNEAFIIIARKDTIPVVPKSAFDRVEGEKAALQGEKATLEGNITTKDGVISGLQENLIYLRGTDDEWDIDSTGNYTSFGGLAGSYLRQLQERDSVIARLRTDSTALAQRARRLQKRPDMDMQLIRTGAAARTYPRQ